MKKIAIAIDAMGGDVGPSVTVPAALEILNEHPYLTIILVGDKSLLEAECKKHQYPFERLQILHASEQVAMDESPASALRLKKDSSMRVALNLVKEGSAQACVSAGNTGALMAIAKFVLKTLPGIDRPAIVYSLPTELPSREFGHVRMLDLGANVDCTAEHLFQFAVMGSVLSQAVDGVASPRVALLNIGAEAIKGSEQVKLAAQLLSNAQSLNYTGFIEGNDIYKCKADVVVCDGFVGNVALKSSEGVASMMMRLIKQEFTKNIRTRFIGWLARPILKCVLSRIDPKRYNGASLLGLNGIVIKSHGNAERVGFKVAIREAIHEVAHNVPEHIRSQVAHYLNERQSA